MWLSWRVVMVKACPATRQAPAAVWPGWSVALFITPMCEPLEELTTAQTARQFLSHQVRHFLLLSILTPCQLLWLYSWQEPGLVFQPKMYTYHSISFKMSTSIMSYCPALSVHYDWADLLFTAVSLCLAPCPPVSSSVTVSVICDNATALFSWAWSSGAASYELTAISNNGYIATCISQENYCNISQLACGQTYKVRLTAVSDGCQVTEETGLTFQTRELKFLFAKGTKHLQCNCRKGI